MKITIAHSPDSDDAFMFYGLAKGKLDTFGLDVSHVLKDIESLNRDALQGTYEVTACSFHAYPYIADKYALMPCGGSIGDGYGPILVAKTSSKIVGGPGGKDFGRVAIPGTLTSAYLALRLYAPEVDTYVVPFDAVFEEVLSGRADCGLVIHEGQLTFGGEGLRKIVDLGEWWESHTGLPVPLAGICARADLDPALAAAAESAIRASVAYAFAHPEASRPYVRAHSQEMSDDVCDQHIRLYVNAHSLDIGDEGLAAIGRLTGATRA